MCWYTQKQKSIFCNLCSNANHFGFMCHLGFLLPLQYDGAQCNCHSKQFSLQVLPAEDIVPI